MVLLLLLLLLLLLQLTCWKMAGPRDLLQSFERHEGVAVVVRMVTLVVVMVKLTVVVAAFGSVAVLM